MKMYEPKARIATATSWTVARAACRTVFHMVIRLGDGRPAHGRARSRTAVQPTPPWIGEHTPSPVDPVRSRLGLGQPRYSACSAAVVARASDAR